MINTYFKLKEFSQGIYKEKGSKFIAYAYPIRNLDEIKAILTSVRKEHYNARHICYAYILNLEKSEFRSNDDGEPSGTGGKPILSQILSFKLSFTIVVVVRYFGGVKLGVGSLSKAYKLAAKKSIENAIILQYNITHIIEIKFQYTNMNDIIFAIGKNQAKIHHLKIDLICFVIIELKENLVKNFTSKISLFDELSIKFINFGEQIYRE